MTDELESIAPVVHGAPAEETPITTTTTTDTETDPLVEGLSQKKLQEVIDRAASRAAKSARADLERVAAENQRLKEQLAGSAPDATALEKVRSELSLERARADQATKQAQEIEKRSHLQSLAGQFGVVPKAEADVTRLIRDNIRQENGAWVAVDDNGTPITKSDGTPMSAAEYYAQFTNNRPWVLSGVTRSGTGSVGSTGSIAQTQPYVPETLWGPNARPDAGKVLNEWSKRDARGYQLARLEAKRKGLVY